VVYGVAEKIDLFPIGLASFPARATVKDDNKLPSRRKGSLLMFVIPLTSQVAKQNTKLLLYIYLMRSSSPPPFILCAAPEAQLAFLSFQLNNFFLIPTTTFYHHQTNGFVFSLHKSPFCLNVLVRLSIDSDSRETKQSPPTFSPFLLQSH